MDEFEIRIFLYDGKDEKTFSESAQITMRAGEDVKARLPLKFLFTVRTWTGLQVKSVAGIMRDYFFGVGFWKGGPGEG